ncbi:pca operon transcription factor PcaQ [Pseudomonas poae]|uniref:Pca operon transcription factor PcaQ n=1 Tax=Pseudomonas poae TaxID=200451 RepID=A0A423EQN5_9PSED|nr:pca operon transcription factor PcaQ [Pseudomonas poae]ROM33614.1 pca operon transcription factor PcaQ [Pseudomonas poae]
MNIDTRIKFRHLVCFLEVARQGSLARACDKLAISQPALSKTLKELESLLEASLFERGKKGSTLTEAGVAFLRYAAPSVQSLREGVHHLRSGVHKPITVQLGVLSTVESLLVPEAVCRLHALHRALVVSVVTGPSAYLLSRLRVGELDLVVGRMTDSPLIQGLAFEHLYSESMTLVVRNGHPALADSPGQQHLEDYPLVLPSEGTTIRKFADSMFVQHGITPSRQRLETLSVALSRRYVQCSQAIWVAPLDAVRQDLQQGALVELDLGMREPGGSVGFCSNPALPLGQAAQWCAQALREVGQEYREGKYP